MLIYYSAGNFEVFQNEGTERNFKEAHEKMYKRGYNRLTSFFFLKASKVVLAVNDNVEGEDVGKKI